ncbi:tetratricopeptide repeat protein [Lysinibacillus xylanilyticus]|uniref:Uncharacterized protein n=1 Tax=Lysinibacillus xylanilyticus TaxID=582475 RepID=A0A2M9Q9W6_9BACI|nr:tetratricopeptide repeat protein [Lysinibacillus xylanilyticus]PJO44873.1 hypothetical protein CWD94_04085 [Lysinibacillus xylanilyticus]
MGSNEIKQLKFCNIDSQRNINFVGRKSLLEKIQNELNKNNVVAIHGMWGMGKTQLAIEYSYVYRNDYEVLIWLAAESHEILINSYRNIARNLGLPVDYEQYEDLINNVKNWFQKNTNWLLIIDNANSVDEIYNYLPNSMQGDIIITSRNASWSTIASEIEIDVLEQEESKELLLKSGAISDSKDVNELCRLLGDLPLAIEQARAYIHETKISVAEYIKRFNKYKVEILDRGQPFNYKETVTSTCKLAISKVNEYSPTITELLHLLAFFGPDNIPMNLLRQGEITLPENLSKMLKHDLEYDEMVGIIRRYSLLNVIDNNTFSIHRLIQMVIRETFSENERKMWIERCLDLILNLFNFEQSDLESIDRASILQPHAAKIGEFALEFKIRPYDTAMLFNRIGDYYFFQSLFLESRDFYNTGYTINKEQFGNNTNQICQNLMDLGYVQFKLGEYNEAKNCLQQAIKIAESINSKELLIDIYNRYAVLMENLDRLKIAEEYFKKSLDLIEKKSDKTEIEMATYASILNGFAELLSKQGQLANALIYYQQALDIFKELYGPEHFLSASIYANIGVMYSKTNYKEAKKYLSLALYIYQKSLGPEHPEIGRIQNNLGLVLLEEGKIKEAIKLFEESLTSDKVLFGEVHPKIAVRLNNIGLAYSKMGKYIKSLEFYKKALKINEMLFIPPHQTIATQYNNIGVTYSKMGQFIEAIKYLEQSLKTEKEIYGPKSSQILDSLIELTVVLIRLNDMDRAKSYVMESYDIANKSENGNYYLSKILPQLIIVLSSKGEHKTLTKYINKK